MRRLNAFCRRAVDILGPAQQAKRSSNMLDASLGSYPPEKLCPPECFGAVSYDYFS